MSTLTPSQELRAKLKFQKILFKYFTKKDYTVSHESARDFILLDNARNIYKEKGLPKDKYYDSEFSLETIDRLKIINKIYVKPEKGFFKEVIEIFKKDFKDKKKLFFSISIIKSNNDKHLVKLTSNILPLFKCDLNIFILFYNNNWNIYLECNMLGMSQFWKGIFIS